MPVPTPEQLKALDKKLRVIERTVRDIRSLIQKARFTTVAQGNTYSLSSAAINDLYLDYQALKQSLIDQFKELP